MYWKEKTFYSQTNKYYEFLQHIKQLKFSTNTKSQVRYINIAISELIQSYSCSYDDRKAEEPDPKRIHVILDVSVIVC